jgi:adenylate kinase family enzyme
MAPLRVAKFAASFMSDELTRTGAKLFTAFGCAMKAQFIPRWMEGRRLRTIDTRHDDITRQHRRVMNRIRVRRRQSAPLITTSPCETRGE